MTKLLGKKKYVINDYESAGKFVNLIYKANYTFLLHKHIWYIFFLLGSIPMSQFGDLYYFIKKNWVFIDVNVLVWY